MISIFGMKIKSIIIIKYPYDASQLTEATKKYARKKNLYTNMIDCF